MMNMLCPAAASLLQHTQCRIRFLDELPSLQPMISVDEPYAREIDAVWLEEVTRTALASTQIPSNSQVSLLVTGDDTIRSLNAEYRGLDETTDVLSFSADYPGQWEGEGDGPSLPEAEFVLPPGASLPLGEIIVSWPQARRQAGELGVSPIRELAHLVIHGALHLVGYDHVEPCDAALMQERERQALESLRMPGP